MENQNEPKSAGRPKNAKGKRFFSLPDVIKNRFPNRKEILERRLADLTTAKASKGKTLLNLYFLGEKTLTARESVISKCCECFGYWEDGKVDCEDPLCPLYPFQPYRAKDSKKSKEAPCSPSSKQPANISS